MPDQIREFTKVGDAIPVPPLTDIQTRSYDAFLQQDVPPEKRTSSGLEGLFCEVFPIRSPESPVVVEYLRYQLGPPVNTPDECRRLRHTYGYTLHARIRVSGSEVIEDDVYLGEVPKMLGGGEFIINGAERIVVSQIRRSPGIDFAVGTDSNGRTSYSCRIVPERGTWIELSISPAGLLQARVGQSGKMPGTWLLRSLLPGSGTDNDLLALFYNLETVSLDEPTVSDLVGRRLATEVVNIETGEVLKRAGLELDAEDLKMLRRGGMEYVQVLKDVHDTTILNTLEKDPTRSQEEALQKIHARFRPGVLAPVEKARAFLRNRFEDPRRYSLGSVGRFRINRKLGQEVPLDVLTLRSDDLLRAVRYLLELRQGKGEPDDIDHLSNRLLRPVGRLAEAHLRDGFLRLRRMIEDSLRLAKEGTIPAPRSLCDSRPVTDALVGFFGRGELSQVVDQTNPLSQLANERRVSSLGPGGLNRKRAGFEVRDVHPSHYGRLCPIETPEGPNIGLISYLSLFADVDKYGFITTPYRPIDDEVPASDGVVRLRADEEADVCVAPAGTLKGDNPQTERPEQEPVVLRKGGDFVELPVSSARYLEVSPKQLIGVSGSLIPFLEHDDANRALMGSNMQRQAVPLLAPQRPLVFTGVEDDVAASSGMVVRSRHDGVVTEVDGEHVVVDDEAYPLLKYRRLNEGTCLNQRPRVRTGQQVRKGDILADGPATVQGELALGQNVLVAFMPFDGYNFEDAVLVSERLVREDSFTSIHIEEYEAAVRETRLGREEFTREIYGIGAAQLANLAEDGVVRVGTKIREGDILVGKVAPRAPKSEPTAEDKLVRAIFGRAGEDVKNDSLTVPPGIQGVVVEVAKYRRKLYLDEEDRRRTQEEARRVRAEWERAASAEFRMLLTRLAGLPLATGRTLYVPPATMSDRQVLRDAQAFRFPGDVFEAGSRDRASEVFRRYQLRAAALAGERDREVRRIRLGDDLPSGVLELVKVYVAVRRRIQVGDKVAGRHGNKGVVAQVLPEEDMPFLPDGTPVDVVLNPLGVPSRMNVGQILETHLGWAARALGFRALTPVFDGANEEEIRQCLEEAGLPRDGKTVLFDGRTGEPFDQKVTVGCLYLLKLDHLVEDKTHARSTGPYSLITQQPLGGKSRRGGQRVGEMEVWALEAYGAANMLQEMLTVKSDGVESRAEMYEQLIKGRNVLTASRPVSFDVAVTEIRGLCLDIKLEKGKETASGPKDDKPSGPSQSTAAGPMAGRVDGGEADA